MLGFSLLLVRAANQILIPASAAINSPSWTSAGQGPPLVVP